MRLDQVLKELKSMANPKNVEGMARFGINPRNTLGISIYDLRKVAKKIGVDHKLAQELWASGIHEARVLAGYIDDPDQVTEAQMERWVRDFDSWDVCDQICSSLFDQTGYAFSKAVAWSAREEEFVKRAGFVLMAALSVHDKDASDKQFIALFPILKRESRDERNFVKKAVNWAIRQIGKRNKALNKAAIKLAVEISKMDSRSARWIAADALRELRGEAVQRRFVPKGR